MADSVPDADHPSYGVALVAVLASGALASAASLLFIGFVALGGMPISLVIGALLGGLIVQVILRLLSFEITYAGAVGAMLAGAVAATMLKTVVPYRLGLAGATSLRIVPRGTGERTADRVAYTDRCGAAAARAPALATGLRRDQTRWRSNMPNSSRSTSLISPTVA
jgi:hypothetical protein